MKALRKWLPRCVCLIFAFASVACTSMSKIEVKPWVKPYERFNLADPIMQFDRHPISGSYIHHVYQAREGARGAEGGSGGGCGCN